MSVEQSVYTTQPAISASQLRVLASQSALEIRFLDLDGKPLDPAVRLDEPMYGQGYVLIGWPASDVETTAAVERALAERNKPEVDGLGMAGKLGWCSIDCREFDFAEFEASLREDLEEDDDEDPEPVLDELLDRMRQARTEYSFRCGTRPSQCGIVLGKVAELLRKAVDGFSDD